MVSSETQCVHTSQSKISIWNDQNALFEAMIPCSAMRPGMPHSTGFIIGQFAIGLRRFGKWEAKFMHLKLQKICTASARKYFKFVSCTSSASCNIFRNFQDKMILYKGNAIIG